MPISRRSWIAACGAWGALAAAGARAAAAASCATSVEALRGLLADPAFPLRWYETTMDDDKPLVLSILDRGGSLTLEFVKTGEGLWVETACVVCRGASGLDARFGAEQVRVGPACNLAVRLTLGNGGQVSLIRLDERQLRLVANGWSSTFSSSEPKPRGSMAPSGFS